MSETPDFFEKILRQGGIHSTFTSAEMDQMQIDLMDQRAMMSFESDPVTGKVSFQGQDIDDEQMERFAVFIEDLAKKQQGDLQEKLVKAAAEVRGYIEDVLQ